MLESLMHALGVCSCAHSHADLLGLLGAGLLAPFGMGVAYVRLRVRQAARRLRGQGRVPALPVAERRG